jgi:hypothetical protein
MPPDWGGIGPKPEFRDRAWLGGRHAYFAAQPTVISVNSALRPGTELQLLIDHLDLPYERLAMPDPGEKRRSTGTRFLIAMTLSFTVLA